MSNYVINYVKSTGGYDGVEVEVSRKSQEEEFCEVINFIIENKNRLNIEFVTECFKSN